MTVNSEKVLTGYTSSIGAFAGTIKTSSWENERFTYTSWDLHILLKAWHYEDCELNNSPIIVRKHTEDREEVDKFLNLPLKNTVIKVKTDWEDLSLGRIDISDLLDYDSVDEILNEYLAGINQIEQFSHQSYGLFLYDSGNGKFVNDILWGEDAIKLEIDSGDKIEAKAICDIQYKNQLVIVSQNTGKIIKAFSVKYKDKEEEKTYYLGRLMPKNIIDGYLFLRYGRGIVRIDLSSFKIKKTGISKTFRIGMDDNDIFDRIN